MQFLINSRITVHISVYIKVYAIISLSLSCMVISTWVIVWFRHDLSLVISNISDALAAVRPIHLMQLGHCSNNISVEKYI